MIQKDQWIQLYREQYRNENRRRKAPSIRTKGYMDKIVGLVKVLRRTKNARTTRENVDNYHKQINNLYYCAIRHNNQAALKKLDNEGVPELVRLDLALLLPEDQRMIGIAFLDYLEQESPGAVCRSTLFELFHTYRNEVLKSKILQLVPSRPELEFPEALAMKRHFILHIGPTNSGKTYQALERLKEAQNGIYLGPLRLLALEVYEKMKEYGVPCTMLTGQECIAEPDSQITASTVEMADFNQQYDVAVIDEAQMTADSDRGHCWTKAILGIQASEIHVCMSPVAEQVVTHLIQVCGDEWEIRRYERKTELVCESQPFFFPDDVQPGDALVVFSKKSVLDIAGRLEECGVEASVIYGSLPPEIRRRQMQLFNGGQTKVVVATDAIGMGLNLPVRRIVFIQTEKFDGVSRRGLTTQEIKQIAGRAGRFGIYDTGYVSAMGEESLDYVRQHFDAEEPPINKVSLGFPQVLLDLEEPLDVILKVWHSEKAQPPFEKVSIEELLCLYGHAKRFQDYIMDFDDKNVLYRMISCPIDVKDHLVVKQWLQYCMDYPADSHLDYPRLDRKPMSGKGSGHRQGGNEAAEGETSSDKRKIPMQNYETYYKKLDLYYQFSHRFDKIIDEEWLEKERGRTEAAIMRYLTKGKKGYIVRCLYCGRTLPVGYPFTRCQLCYEKTERHGQRNGRGGMAEQENAEKRKMEREKPRKQEKRTEQKGSAEQRENAGQKT